MAERIAYFGLSYPPAGDDYANEAAPTQLDGSSSPNPILEGVFGAM